MTLEWIGLLGSLALLIVLTMRGVDLLLAAPVCALLLALSFGLPLVPQLAGVGAGNFTTAYMTGFSGFIASWFFVFLLGSVFGKVMEDSGAADSVAQWVVERFGARHALLAVIGACAILTYGGVSLFVVAFSVFPLALALFREAGLPRRFIPGAIGFGSVTFTMTSAGSPEIQNWIPMQYLGTTPYAAWQVSLVVALVMAVSGFVWLKWMIGRSLTAGERYDVRDGDPQPKTGGLPHPATGLIPLAAVLGVAFALHDSLQQSALIVALLAGVLTVLVVNRKYFINLPHAVSNGTLGALIAIAKGDAPESLWFEMERTQPATHFWQRQRPQGRREKIVRGHRVHGGSYAWRDLRYVPSWGGSMFEALDRLPEAPESHRTQPLRRSTGAAAASSA